MTSLRKLKASGEGSKMKEHEGSVDLKGLTIHDVQTKSDEETTGRRQSLDAGVRAMPRGLSCAVLTIALFGACRGSRKLFH